MAKHNLTQAAKLAGVSRSTIMRHLSEGKLSKEIGKDGKPCIDTSEIERVYGLTQSRKLSDTDAINTHKTHQIRHKDSALEVEVCALRQEKTALLEQQLRELREERDSWKKEAEDWKRQAQNLLSDHRIQSEAKKPTDKHRGLLSWLRS
jgi:hypothetical protein